MAHYDNTGEYEQGETGGLWQSRWIPGGGAGPTGGRHAPEASERQPHIFGAHALQYRQGGRW